MSQIETPHGLTARQAAFVEEYLVDLCATQAAIRAGYARATANREGSRLLSNAVIQSAIAKARAERSQRVQITQDMVLARYWAIATADANEISQLRRVNCRHCWGIGHAFQWKQEEYNAACERAEEKDKPFPDDAGGMGFQETRPPHPDCPKCEGEGYAVPHFKDTRTLTGGARLLYAGVKTTQHGIEVKVLDQMAALAMVAKHVGLDRPPEAVTDGPVIEGEVNPALRKLPGLARFLPATVG